MNPINPIDLVNEIFHSLALFACDPSAHRWPANEGPPCGRCNKIDKQRLAPPMGPEAPVCSDCLPYVTGFATIALFAKPAKKEDA